MFSLLARFSTRSAPQRITNHRIQSATNQILLLNEQGQRLGLVSLSGKLAEMDTSRHSLVQLGQASVKSPSNEEEVNVPVCRIFSADQLKEERQRQTASARESRKPSVRQQKDIRINAAIASHDLQVSLRKMTELIEKGHPVRVLVQPQNTRASFKLFQEEQGQVELKLLRQVEQHLMPVAKVHVAAKQQTNKAYSMTFGPK
jgi:translation initiation factor IF-3